MPDASWKQWERDVAAALGGSRSGPTGRDTPDVDVEYLAPECKYQKRLAYRESDWTQAKENAAKVGKVPALFLKERGGKRKRVVMDFDQFVELFKMKGLPNV